MCHFSIFTPAREYSSHRACVPNVRPITKTGAGIKSQALFCLADFLETNTKARVYFRASGGLARLAGITAAAATSATADSQKNLSIDNPTRNKTVTPASTSIAAPVRSSTSSGQAIVTGRCSTNGFDSTGDSSTRHGPTEQHDAARVVVEGDRQLELMLRAVAAALEGGERLAQQEILKSGLLSGPCAQVLRKAREVDAQEDSPEVSGWMGAAGAAALVLYRVADDDDVRAHVARCALECIENYTSVQRHSM